MFTTSAKFYYFMLSFISMCKVCATRSLVIEAIPDNVLHTWHPFLRDSEES